MGCVRTVMASGVMALAGCAAQGPALRTDVAADGHERLMKICAVSGAPADRQIAEMLGLSDKEVAAWRTARALDPDQLCRLSAPQLARSLSKAGLGVPATGGEDSRRYNEGFYRSDDGTTREDGKYLALVERESLLATQTKAGGVTTQTWTNLGPERLGGRMRALRFDRLDASRIYVGSATGGIWMSSDAGASWAPVNDFSASLSISTITQSALDVNVLYATTGEWSQSHRGAGVLKSTDRGLTWQALPGTSPSSNSNWRYTQGIAIDPVNELNLLVTDLCGVVRSQDGGMSWVRVYGSSACDPGFRVLFHPSSPSIVMAGLRGRAIARSTDGGGTFTKVQIGTSTAAYYAGLVDIAVSSSSPSTWYASVDENAGDIYRSTDAGATWTKRSNPGHLGNQGWYGNVIWVDPTNASVVVIAGIDSYRSTDGGLTWTKISDWVRGYRSGGGGGTGVTVSAHADHHVIVEAPGYDGSGNRAVFFGTDGGLYRQSDILSAGQTQGWAPLTTGMRTTQFYRISAKALPGGVGVLGGAQDNSWQYLGPGDTAWQQPTTGDGGPVYFDPQDSNRVYSSFQFLALWRWSPPTVFAGVICGGITEVSAMCAGGSQRYAQFIAPFVVNPANGEQILAGAASLWLTENARSAATPSWRIVKPAQTDISGTPANFINAIAQRPDSPGVVFVGHEDGQVFSTDNVFAASPVWVRRDGGLMPARRVTQIVIDPANPSRVFALYGGFNADNIWVSDDGGVTWRNTAAGLPAAPVYALAIRPGVPTTLYAGTEVGLFVSEDSGATWSTTNDGPAAVAVRDLAFADDWTLVAATYGRGVWKATLSSAGSLAVVGSATPAQGGVVSCQPPVVLPGGASACAATASPGYLFAGFGGSCTGATCALSNITTNQTVTGVFIPTASWLVNGDFERPPAGWVEQSPYVIVGPPPPQITARSGRNVAYLGGYDNGIDVLYQSVTIPADAADAYLTFWYLVATDKAPGASATDNLVVSVHDTAGEFLGTLVSLSNRDASQGWVRSPTLALSGYRGQTVRLTFTATTNMGPPTAFFIDDVVLGSSALSLSAATISGNPAAVSRGAVSAGPGLTLSSGANAAINAGRGVRFIPVFRVDSGARLQVRIDPDLAY